MKKINIKKLFYLNYFIIALLPLFFIILLFIFKNELILDIIQLLAIITNILIWINTLLLIIFYKKEKFGLLEAFSIGIYAIISILSILNIGNESGTIGDITVKLPFVLLYYLYYIYIQIISFFLTIAMYNKYENLYKKKSNK